MAPVDEKLSVLRAAERALHEVVELVKIRLTK
jgi:hypothetical protein